MNNKAIQFIKQNQLLLIVVSIMISLIVGYWQWNNEFRRTYYSEETTLQGQLFTNVVNTSVETVENFPLFTQVPYDKVTLKIGSLTSKNDDSNEASKSNNIINSVKLDEKFKKWLIKAFNKEEAKKITDHLDVYYRNEKIHEISY